MIDDAKRAAIVAEALTWLRTPYHHKARVKGAGADCALFPAAVYEACKVIPHIEPDYVRDWYLHRREERYLEWVRRFGVEIPEAAAKPADFVLWKWGLTYSHGGIVVGPTTVIHAYLRVGVTLDDWSQHEELRTRPRLFFTLAGG